MDGAKRVGQPPKPASMLPQTTETPTAPETTMLPRVAEDPSALEATTPPATPEAWSSWAEAKKSIETRHLSSDEPLRPQASTVLLTDQADGHSRRHLSGKKGMSARSTLANFETCLRRLGWPLRLPVSRLAYSRFTRQNLNCRVHEGSVERGTGAGSAERARRGFDDCGILACPFAGLPLAGHGTNCLTRLAWDRAARKSDGNMERSLCASSDYIPDAERHSRPDAGQGCAISRRKRAARISFTLSI